MRKRCRSRVRSRGKVVLNAYTRMVAYFAYAQLSEKWREWNFRTISQRQAETLVAAGEATPITREVNGEVQLVGYRALQPTSWERPSPATLTFATMEAVRREAMHERLTRRQRAEVVKFKVWPLIGDTKAVAVRPKISEAEYRLAMKLLGPAWMPTASQSGMLSAA
jgi:hypothetical protein